MGYTTEFEGQFDLSRELTVKEYNLLKELAEERHDGNGGIHHDPHYPGLYCQWVPDSDGTAIVWDGNEKFYDYVKWMNFIIDRFLVPWGIAVSGRVHYQGESVGDHGYLVIKDGRCVQVDDDELVEDLRTDIQSYVQELSAWKGPGQLTAAMVIDRLSTILGRHAP